MGTWVLVMTIVGFSSQYGPAIHSVLDFPDQATCVREGNRWLTDLRLKSAGANGTYNSAPTFVCMSHAR